MKDLAVVLKAVRYQDRHQIITALTQSHGKITAMARNSVHSRRFGASLEPFTAGEWEVYEKGEFWSLTEAQTKRSFEGIRKDFTRLSLASVFSEIMLRVAPPHQACPELFRMHSNALATVEEHHQPGNEIFFLTSYFAKILQWSGYQPLLKECLGECGRDLRDSIQDNLKLLCLVKDAGWICEVCRREKTRHVVQHIGEGIIGKEDLHPLSAVAVMDFFLSLIHPIRRVHQEVQGSHEEHLELFQYLEALMAYHVPGFDQTPLKSLQFCFNRI